MKKGVFGKLKRFFFPCRENNYQARFLEGELLFTLLVVIFVLRILFLPFYAYFPRNLFFAEIVSTDIITLLNQQRESEGISTLSPDQRLDRAAALKAQDMLEKDYFAHESPEGTKAWSFIEQTGYDYSVAGENLAIGFLDSSEVYQAWNNSPLHKRNLLDPRFKNVGVAVMNGEFKGKRTTVVVQLFGLPASESYTEADKPPVQPAPQVSEQEISVVEGSSEPAPPAPSEPSVAVEEEVSSEKEAPPSPSKPEQSPEPAPQVQAPDSDSVFPELEKKILRFVTHRYDQVARRAVLGIGVGLGVVLSANLFVILRSPLKRRMKLISLKNLLIKGGASLLLLLFLGMIDKTFIIQIIPHTIEI